MIRFVLLLVFITAISVLQISTFRKRHLKKEMWGYITLMAGVAVISCLQLLCLPHGSLITPLETLFEPIGKFILGS